MIKDSGDRHEFTTGAVRDMAEGKGRCDLLPPLAIIRLSKHFEEGAKKYGERNWEKGIPINSFIDSAMRHTLKYMAGQDDALVASEIIEKFWAKVPGIYIAIEEVG